jgi:DnaK suppressor protein
MKTPIQILKRPTLKHRRAALEAKIEQLTAAFQDRSGLIVQNAADPTDVICMATDRNVLVRQVNIGARTLTQVRHALATLDRGEYGICDDCAEPISPRRLDAIPWTRVCVKCQEVHDSRESADPGLEDAA